MVAPTATRCTRSQNGVLQDRYTVRVEFTSFVLDDSEAHQGTAGIYGSLPDVSMLCSLEAWIPRQQKAVHRACREAHTMSGAVTSSGA